MGDGERRINKIGLDVVRDRDGGREAGMEKARGGRREEERGGGKGD